MRKLSPRSIANYHTLHQIETKIGEYQEAIDAAAQGGYSFDTTAGSQRVKSPDPDQLESLLEAWIRAWEIKSGISRTRFYSADYHPHGGPV